MNIRIELNKLKRNAFKWSYKSECYFSGYLFGDNGEFLQGENAIDFIIAQADLKTYLKTSNGVFSLVYKKDDSLFIFSDKSRFIPVFYSFIKNEFVVSDNFDFLLSESENPIIDNIAKYQFLVSSFTFNDRTLIEGIKQVQAGELVSFTRDEIKCEILYRFSKSPNEMQKVDDQLFSKAEKSFKIIGKHLADSLQGRPVLLPLSGGFDSRLIACWLKSEGVENVTCYTFGRKGYYEIDVSRKVAESLGYKWYYVEYNEEVVKDFLKDEIFHELYRFLAQGTSMFFMQDYFSVKKLFADGIVDESYIVIPGHASGALAGSLLNKTVPAENKIVGFEDVVIANYAHQLKHKKADHKMLQKEIEKSLPVAASTNFPDYAKMEDWVCRERISKYIFNSGRIFSFYNMECRFPFWDNEFADFFLSLPVEQRLYKKLYDKVCEEAYFKKMGVYFGDWQNITSRKFEIQKIKNKIRPYLPQVVKQYYNRKNDWQFYNQSTQYFLDELKTKKWKFTDNGSNYLYRILNWYLLKITETIEELRK